MEAQHRCGWIEIGFVVVEEARGDADCGWTRHRNFAQIGKVEYADCRSGFVFHVHGHECLESFEMAEMAPRLLWNDLPMQRCWVSPAVRSSAGSQAHQGWCG